MRDTNQVIIVGRLANNITLTYNNNNTAIGRFPLAFTTSRKTADKWTDISNYIEVTVYGSTAKNLQDYLRKGKQVCVTGELHQDRWEDKDGKKNYSVYIVATNVQLLGGNKNSQQEQQQAPTQEPPIEAQQAMYAMQQQPQYQSNNQAYIDNPPQQPQNNAMQQLNMMKASGLIDQQSALLDENGNEIIY